MIYFIISLLIGIILKDLIQKKHTIKRNFPLIGNLRYLIESVGKELRQYLFADNRSERPFNRVERSYIYASAKGENNNSGFGSDADFNRQGHFFIKHSAFPISEKATDEVVCAKIVGPRRKKPFQPRSIVNISAMSYGALGYKATEANARGSTYAGAYHNTGEGGISQYHNADDMVFQIGTGYFGCGSTNAFGKRQFSLQAFETLVKTHPSIKMIEVKLSQGAKPGKGGVLPAAKVTAEIASIRGIEEGKDAISPSSHSAFSNVDELIEFVELLAEKTGLPVGIKSAVGQSEFWEELAEKMFITKKGPDFITIDGGEGGTGAAPVPFADHVSLPFVDAFAFVYKTFKKYNITNDVVFIASAKLGFPAKAVMAFAMGADMINIAREIMLSAGCIQAQKCHTGNCPAGIATHKWWLQHGFDVNDKSDRVARFIKTLRKDILELSYAAGYHHPSEFKMKDIVMNTNDISLRKTLADIYDYEK